MFTVEITTYDGAAVRRFHLRTTAGIFGTVKQFATARAAKAGARRELNRLGAGARAVVSNGARPAFLAETGGRWLPWSTL